MYAMDANNNSSGNVITYNNTQLKTGWHAAVGVLAEKKWKNRWFLQVGMGLNHSTWQTNSFSYRDSFSIGASQVIRTNTGSTANQFTLYAFEIPVQLGSRLAGRKTATLWWMAGINQQLALSLKNREAQTVSTTTNSFATITDEKIITGSARLYQPQVRVGLMYEHAGKKMTWQLAPSVNYSIPPMLQSGESYHLVNYQLQWRIVGGKLPKRKK
jgi:hypothetical protein